MFDLEKFKAGVPAYTRTGRPARFLGYYPEIKYTPNLVVCVQSITNDEIVLYYHEGICPIGNSLDLVMFENEI